MNGNAQNLFHWTVVAMGGGMILTPIAVIANRNSEYNKETTSARPLNDVDDKLRTLFDEELSVISKRRWRSWYTSEPKNVLVELRDDIESSTGGLFVYLNDAILRFSSRLTMDDVDTVRRRYPNFLDAFKHNFAPARETSVKGVWHNFRTALGFRDLYTIFEEKGTHHFNVDSTQLSDEDIQTVLLSRNAKKFAVARELIDADRINGVGIFMHSLVSFMAGWILFGAVAAKSKWVVGGTAERLALTVAYAFALTSFCTLCWIDKRGTVIALDNECMALGDAYISGAKDYLHASLALGKCLHRLTDGASHFDAVGDYARHPMPYSVRLKSVEHQEQKLLKKRQKTAGGDKATTENGTAPAVDG